MANLTSDGVFNYTYDGSERLVQASNGATLTNYKYNGIGQRVAKTGSGISTGTTVFSYDPSGNLMGEYDASGNAFIETVWLEGMPVGVMAAGTQFYVIPDHLGAPYAVTDTTGNKLWAWDHDPFGNGAAPVYSLRFPGQYFDSETGLHYNMARTYDPTTGRYIQSDPIGLAGGLNTYAYVGNDPINKIDPLGLATGDWWDIPANFDRTQQIAKEELAKRPNSHNNIGDAMRHSEWMKRTSQETNTFTAWIAGTGHEIEGTLKGQPWNEMLMDLHNNSVGREAGNNNSSIDPSKLWTLPLNDSQYNPYSDVCGK